MTNEIKHNRPKYSLEFKQDAAKLVLEKGYQQKYRGRVIKQLHRRAAEFGLELHPVERVS